MDTVTHYRSAVKLSGLILCRSLNLQCCVRFSPLKSCEMWIYEDCICKESAHATSVILDPEFGDGLCWCQDKISFRHPGILDSYLNTQQTARIVVSLELNGINSNFTTNKRVGDTTCSMTVLDTKIPGKSWFQTHHMSPNLLRNRQTRFFFHCNTSEARYFCFSFKRNPENNKIWTENQTLKIQILTHAVI